MKKKYHPIQDASNPNCDYYLRKYFCAKKHCTYKKRFVSCAKLNKIYIKNSKSISSFLRNRHFWIKICIRMKEAWILYRSSNHATVSSTTFLNASRCMLFANPADKTRRANLVVGTYCIVRRTPRFPTFHVKMCVYIYIYDTRFCHVHACVHKNTNKCSSSCGEEGFVCVYREENHSEIP